MNLLVELRSSKDFMPLNQDFPLNRAFIGFLPCRILPARPVLRPDPSNEKGYGQPVQRPAQSLQDVQKRLLADGTEFWAKESGGAGIGQVDGAGC